MYQLKTIAWDRQLKFYFPMQPSFSVLAFPFLHSSPPTPPIPSRSAPVPPRASPLPLPSLSPPSLMLSFSLYNSLHPSLRCAWYVFLFRCHCHCQSELQATYNLVRSEMDSAFETQADLEDHQQKVRDFLTEPNQKYVVPFTFIFLHICTRLGWVGLGWRVTPADS